MNKNSILKLTMLALLTALVVLMTVTNIGYIPIGGFSITLMCLPVIVASVIFGFKGGLILGAAFALSSLYMAFVRPSAFAAILVSYPLALYSSVFIPRLLIGVFTTLVYRATAKLKSSLRFAISAAVGSLTNTVFFLGFVMLFGAQPLAQAYGTDIRGVGLMLLGIAGTNGILEVIASIIICTPLLSGLKAAMPKLFINNKSDGVKNDTGA